MHLIYIVQMEFYCVYFHRVSHHCKKKLLLFISDKDVDIIFPQIETVNENDENVSLKIRDIRRV